MRERRRAARAGEVVPGKREGPVVVPPPPVVAPEPAPAPVEARRGPWASEGPRVRRPPVVVEDFADDVFVAPAEPAAPRVALSEALPDQERRVAFMVDRHQKDLEDLDAHIADLRELLGVAKRTGEVSDTKLWMAELRQTMARRADCNAKLSAAMDTWKDFATKDNVVAHITFVTGSLADIPVVESLAPPTGEAA